MVIEYWVFCVKFCIGKEVDVVFVLSFYRLEGDTDKWRDNFNMLW